MTIILGIDPGATTGWCLYDSDARCVLEAGEFVDGDANGFDIDAAVIYRAECAVLERPKGYGPTRPQMVECGIMFGDLRHRLRLMRPVREMLRLEVCQTLTLALHGVLRVRNDATAWAALLELHGGTDAVKKGGPLHGVKSHSRAALAVAVAFSLRGVQ